MGGGGGGGGGSGGGTMKIYVFDHGPVELLGSFGDELTIVNAARVSFGSESSEFTTRDDKLMRYLWKNKHFSPFRHVIVRLRLVAPEFVLRQAYKHVVGIETTSSSSCKDHAWNEISGRYKPVEEYYVPETWRAQHMSSKQASAGPLSEEENAAAKQVFAYAMESVQAAYNSLLQLGVAKEQARILLPLNQYTQVIWTCSLQALMNFIELRDHDHAQEEIRVYAVACKKILESICPSFAKMLQEDN